MNKKFLLIPIWRWLLLLVLFVGVSFNSYDFMKFSIHSQPGLFDIIVYQNNDITQLCFILPFAWFLIIGDIGNGNALNKKIKLFNYMLREIRYIFLVNIIVIVLLFFLNIISLLLNTGTISLWAGRQVGNGISTLVISLLFLYLRFVFLSLVIYLINMNLKNQLGILGAIVISLFDWKFYSVFQIAHPLGILPIEHTRIYYTEAIYPMGPGDSRFSISVSFVYWGLIIILLSILILWSLKKLKTKKNVEKKVKRSKQKLLSLNSKITIFSKAYIAGVSILVASTFIFLCINLRFDIFEGLSTLGFNNLFVFNFISNPFIEVLVPIVTCLIIIGTTNNYCGDLIGRNKKRRFRLKYLYIIIAGGSVFIVSSTIVLIVFILVSPLLGSPVFEISGLFSNFYNDSSLVYIALYLIHSFVFGGIFALFSFSIYNLSNNKFNTIVLSFIGYRASTYVPIIQNSDINTYMYAVVPMFPYEIIGFGDSIWINTLQLVLIFLVSLILLNLKEKRVKETIK